MKNQTQIGKHTNESPGTVQIHGRQIRVKGQLAGLVRQGAKLSRVTPKRFVLDAIREASDRGAKTSQTARRLRDLRITRRCRDKLFSLAVTLDCDPHVIWEKAIPNYMKFVEDYPQLADAQPRVKQCDALLTCNPPQELSDKLDYISFVYKLDADQVADSAISVYVEYAESQPDRYRRLLEDNPGEIDPAQIAFMLSTASPVARATFETAVSEIKRQQFDQACDKLKGLLELAMHHPGFTEERIALEMIVEGLTRLDLKPSEAAKIERA
jgi:predicted transcriptional regulator